MIEIGGYVFAFIATVAAVFIYIYRDKGNFMGVTNEIRQLREMCMSQKKLIEEIKQSKDGATQTIMKLRIDIEQFQEHLAKVREQIQITDRNQRRLQKMYGDKKVVVYMKDGNEYEKDKVKQAWNKQAAELAKKVKDFDV